MSSLPGARRLPLCDLSVSLYPLRLIDSFGCGSAAPGDLRDSLALLLLSQSAQRFN